MNNPDLDKLLRTWNVSGETPASFQREVWQRIEAEEAVRPAWTRWLEMFLRPRIAAATAAVAILAGSAGGLFHAEKSRAHATPDAGLAYAQSINPFDPVHLTRAGMNP